MVGKEKRRKETNQNKNTVPQRRENRKGKEQNILYTAASQSRRKGLCHLHSSTEVGMSSLYQVFTAQTLPFLSSAFLFTQSCSAFFYPSSGSAGLKLVSDFSSSLDSPSQGVRAVWHLQTVELTES